MFSVECVFVSSHHQAIWATGLKPHFQMHLSVKSWHFHLCLWISYMSYFSLSSKLKMKEIVIIYFLISRQHYLCYILKILNFTNASNKDDFVNHVFSRLVKLLWIMSILMEFIWQVEIFEYNSTLGSLFSLFTKGIRKVKIIYTC